MIDFDAIENMLEKIATIVIPLYSIFVVIVYVGGPLTSIWVLWVTYTSSNTTFWFSFLVLLSLVIALKLGFAPLFAAACSWIYFYFGKSGLWLPIISYIIAIIMLVLQLAARKTLNIK
jgi:hypothetical protein